MSFDGVSTDQINSQYRAISQPQISNTNRLFNSLNGSDINMENYIDPRKESFETHLNASDYGRKRLTTLKRNYLILVNERKQSFKTDKSTKDVIVWEDAVLNNLMTMSLH